MNKTRLLLPFFITGTVFLVYSWLVSYPLQISAPTDFAFNHISLLYWISLALLLPSMFLLSVTCKNPLLKWGFCVGIFFVFNSLFLFYTTIPSADANYFRGLNEYFIHNNSLNAFAANFPENHFYYQWPSFFVLSDIFTSVTGLTLVQFEVFLYIVIGFVLTTALYIYVSKFNKYGGPLAVVAFTIVMFSFLNYQAAPFSLALTLLFLLFVLEPDRRALTSQ